jgi:hypothetical protein
MTAQGSPAPGDQDTAEDKDARCWREAARLHREHPRWTVIWLASAHEFRAYARLPGARRDTALTARTPAEMATLIGKAEAARDTTTTHPEDDPQ